MSTSANQHNSRKDTSTSAAQNNQNTNTDNSIGLLKKVERSQLQLS